MGGGAPIKRRGSIVRALERVLLGVGMSVVAFVIERRVLKALKKGGVKPAPRTAGVEEPEPSHDVSAVPDQAGQQPAL
jgi:hypothetical protein